MNIDDEEEEVGGMVLMVDDDSIVIECTGEDNGILWSERAKCQSCQCQSCCNYHKYEVLFWIEQA